jgi:catechol 2,3-dioxygenase-like lactoylglutathione lyase family enzyme
MKRWSLLVIGALAFAPAIAALQEFRGAAPTSTVISSAMSSESQVVLPVADLPRARKFYEALGCAEVSGNATSISLAGGGLAFRLILSREFTVSDFPVAAWRVSTLNDDFLARLPRPGSRTEEAVARIPAGNMAGNTMFPAFGAPSIGAIVKDPDGHLLAFYELVK